MIKHERRSGVLLPLFSLPGEYGIGTLGAGARAFLDKISEAGFRLFQTLPFCPPDGFGSPYAGRSSFAGDPALIDPGELCASGLLRAEEAAELRLPEDGPVDRGRWDVRWRLLATAAERCDTAPIEDFLHENPETAEYCRLAAEREGGDLRTHAFAQYEFFREWEALLAYAHVRGVSVVGDLPLYSAPGSYDTLAYPGAFLPSGVAGVPPDGFSADGQVWGNPLYDYAAMAEDGFSFLRARLSFLLVRLDGVRLDHFRGYAGYYAIPEGCGAREGCWRPGPGQALLDALSDLLSDRLVIAEDLGIIDEGTETLRCRNGLLSTRVFQFAFLGDPESPHLPSRLPTDAAVYSGTHDNDTLASFLSSLSEGQTAAVRAECLAEEGEATGEAVLRTLLHSRAELAILPFADLLLLGGEARINTPGRAEGNWQMRLTSAQLAALDTERYLGLNRAAGRASEG